VSARTLLAAVVGALGTAAIVFVSSKIASLNDRPGGALMASLILIIAVTLIGGQWIGYATVAGSLLATAYYLARPLHSFAVDTIGVRILFVGYLITGIATAALVARLAIAREEAERARRRTDRLQHLTASLSRARTAAAVYEVVLMEGREALGANAGLVATPSDDGSSIEFSATLGFTAAEQEGWQRFSTAVHTPIGDAVLGGEAIFLDEGELVKRYPPLRTSSAPTASVPLRGDGPVLGALGFRFERGHRFTEAERSFATALAEHCAHALERARLYDAERRSREALAMLASIGEHLARSLEADGALRTLAELAVPAVADQCVVDLVRGDRIERRALVHADPALQEVARTLEQFAPDIASQTPVAVAIREGKTQLVPVTHDLPDSAYRSEAHRTAVREIELRSMLTAPLIVRGRTLGALTFGWKRERAFDQEDIELAEQLARRVALALDNGALYQQAHGERERLSALLRQLPLGVLIAEAPSGREVLANARAEAILGRARSTEADAPHMASVRRALDGGSVSDSELVLRRADGSLGVISCSAEPVRDAEGRIVAAVATLFDLTDYRRREEALSFLAEASQALTQSLDFTATLADLVRLAVPRLSDWCSIDLLEHGRIRNVEVANVDPAAVERVRAELQQRPADMDGTTGAAAAIRSGRSELVTEIRAALLDGQIGNADLVRTLNDLGFEPVSSITAPLRAHGRTLGALTLVAAESGRRFSESDLAVANDLARRAALAIDNARLYEAQHEIAHTLQQSLLPGTLVQPPGMEIAARYRPAGIGAEVGGDFYDAWPVDDGFALAIGDVAGKGPGAAALTALTRHAMRIASGYESSPSRVLQVANEAILGHDKASEFCTAALAFLRPSSSGYTLTVACAGHAPPFVLREGSREVEEAGICGTLLGVDLRAEFHDYTTQLAHGDVLAFWTDGVTERRNSGELFGERRLASLLEGLGGESADSIAQHIDEAVVAFAPGLPDDDVAILAARVTTASRVAGRGTSVGHAAAAHRD
jgi:serine phosphatase RsbU (regulator of sigma subunit)/PAS domain-containing protein